MQTEIEAKFLEVDFDALRRKLRELGATCEQPMRTLRRKHFDYPDFRLNKNNGFIRLRDQVDRITLSYKQVDNLTISGTKEVSIEVSNFADAEKVLGILGLRVKSFHETRRESWMLGKVQIEFDEWPWLPAIAEIEAPNEKDLWEVAEKLGLDPQKAVHGTVDYVYSRYYDVTEAEVNKWPEIVFSPVPKELEKRRRP